MANSQAHRQARITLDVFPQKVVLEQMRSHERLSEPYVIEVFVVCEDGEIDFLRHLGKPVALEVLDEDESHHRYFHGLLFEAAFAGWDTSGYRYKLIVRPWLHLLQQNLTYRIFQDMTALDAIKQVLQDGGFGDVEYSKLSGDFRKRKYCVQYRESDFDFISRLMEDEGIYYYFEHQADRHVMVLCNAPGSRIYCANPTLRFRPPSEARVNEQDEMILWEEQVASTGRNVVRLRNFDYQAPQRPVEKHVTARSDHPRDKIEYYDYPAYPFDPGAVERQAAVIDMAQHAGRRIFKGESTGATLACGRLFDLTEHFAGRMNEPYLVVALDYGVISENYRSVAGDREPLSQSILLEAVPAEVAWRAPLATPKPVARGPETAIVMCPAGEEIHTDKWGRVKVRFHWDLTNPTNDTASCWLRVSHNSAGAGFGNIILPRANQEVIVDFLDGDPDRPMITGRVYNASNMQTYGLPGNKTRSVWRSQTVGKAGEGYDGAEEKPPNPGHNEIYFEDKAGEEMFHVYAQRNRETFIRLDDRLRVYRDRKDRVGRDRTVEIKRHETKTVEEGNETHTVKLGNETHTVQTGERTTTIKKDDTLTVQSGNRVVTVEEKDYVLTAKKGSVTVEAQVQIVLKVGQNSIIIDQKGVTISALSVSYASKTSLSINAAKVDIAGTAMTNITGGVVKIN